MDNNDHGNNDNGAVTALRRTLSRRDAVKLSLVGLTEVTAGATTSAAWTQTKQRPPRRVIHVKAGAAIGGDGSARQPFGTLEAAREAVRKARTRGETVEVLLRAGTYELREPLLLGVADSGTPENPVVWRAATPKETVRIVAGKLVRGMEPVRDPLILARLAPEVHSKVQTLDLRAQGVTDYGDPQGGFGVEGDPGLELFVDDIPMSLSRYPNEGFIRITEVLGQTPIDVRGTKGTKEGIFRVDDPRVARWSAEKDPRVLGYWFWDWADQRQKIASVDATTRTITLREPWHGSGYQKGQYFYGFNLLSEIDRPGEWYLDREEGRLYFYPPTNKKIERVMVSVLPAVMRIEGAKHIVFRGLTFEGARGNGVEITRSENCSLVGCVIRNCGKWAIRVRGGKRCAVRGCDITGTGEGGVELEGGERATLTPGEHVVENCHIHHYSRWTRTYQPGIRLSGVGCRAARNLIHDAPHQAIGLGGNDHLIEANEVHNVCEESNDAGALYGWHDWAARGNVIRHNWFHHIYGHEGRGANGVYLDDNFSSALIEGNVFEAVERAIHLGGGRDHRVSNNLFVDCLNALHIDARGLGWRAYGFEELKKTLEAQPYRQPPWSTRYPELLTLLEKEPMAPVGIVVTRNVIVGEQRWDDIEGKAKPYLAMTDNLLGVGPEILAKRMDRQVPRLPVSGSAESKIGFKPIPYERIGLYKSSERVTWPVLHPATVRERRATSSTLARHPAAVTPLAIPRLASPPPLNADANGATNQAGKGYAVLRLAETPGREPLPTSPAIAQLGHDGRRLYVFVTVPMAEMAKLQKSGDWGAADGVEVVLRLDGVKPGPIFILQGFPDGRFLASQDGGASLSASAALRKASTFGVNLGKSSWTAKFAIDLTAADIQVKPGTVLGFNIGARRNETNDWMAWTGTGSTNWQLAGAGRIVLR